MRTLNHSLRKYVVFVALAAGLAGTAAIQFSGGAAVAIAAAAVAIFALFQV